MISFRHLALAILGGAVCLIAPLGAQERGYRLEHDNGILRLAPGQNVIVNNGYGDVRVRYGGSEGDLEFFAALQQFDREGAPLQVERTTTADAVTFDVYTLGEDGKRVLQRQPEQRKRADLVLLLPQGAALNVQTDHGLIQVRGVRSDVRARTRSGNIQARSIRGDIDLESGSGNVLVALPAEVRSGPQRIAAGTGTLRLLLAEDGDFSVRAQGDGPITTEFPLRFERDSQGARIGVTTHGKGSTPVEVRYGQGMLHLERKPSARQAGSASNADADDEAAASGSSPIVKGQP